MRKSCKSNTHECALWVLILISLYCSGCTSKGGQPEQPTAVDSVPVAITLGEEKHTWQTLLGGVIGQYSIRAGRIMADAIARMPGEVLIDYKTPGNGFGYRFDLDFWEPTAMPDYWILDNTENDPLDFDDIFQIFGLPNVTFILSIPTPDLNGVFIDVPAPYPWQTPEFYGAMCQYLFGVADDLADYDDFPDYPDFFDSEHPEYKSKNWANLRAKRGHPEPYTARALILGEEPTTLDGFAEHNGSDYGALVEKFRQQIRARGIDIPYGVCLDQSISHDLTSPWFHPMMDAISSSDPPTYFDLIHSYQFNLNPDWNRSCPVAVKPDGFNYGFDMDYSRYLWCVEDANIAIADRGLPPGQLGWSEHGITTTSQFIWNDMAGAIHVATWISETMRLDIRWDSFWCLASEGFSTALIQVRDGETFLTPLYYVYEMVSGLKGKTYVETTYESPMGTCLWLPNDFENTALFPWLVVRAFKDPHTGSLSLFVINQDPVQSFRLTGLDSYRIGSWFQVSGISYDAGNPFVSLFDESALYVPIQTGQRTKAPDDPLVFEPLSITRVDFE